MGGREEATRRPFLLHIAAFADRGIREENPGDRENAWRIGSCDGQLGRDSGLSWKAINRSVSHQAKAFYGVSLENTRAGCVGWMRGLAVVKFLNVIHGRNKLVLPYQGAVPRYRQSLLLASKVDLVTAHWCC
jgi:hypothetical protein